MASKNAELERYLARTPRSRALVEEAKKYLPGGDSRTTIFWPPYPIFITHGQGARVWDADGVERLDFINNYTSLILGHAHPAVVEAIRETAGNGTCFAAPTEHQIHLAKILCERIPSVDLVRFTNSGTEATLNCVRLARAFTGRPKIAKFEGGYHGTHDAVNVSIRPPVAKAGDGRRPTPVPEVRGMPQSILDSVVILPYNDTEMARQIILEHRHELAAVLAEPVLGSTGMIPADPSFLAMLREVTSENAILLVFDEVISLRVAPGGGQEHYGITPDLTALGKVIGGGTPVGGFGGRRDIMALCDPSQPGGAVVTQAGTFNANPVTMAAGVATMEQLTPPVYDRLSSLGDMLRHKVQALCDELGVPARVTGMGSLFGIHFTGGPVQNYRDVATADSAFKQRVFLGLLNEGVLMSSRLVGCLSTPMGEAEVDAFADALRKVLLRSRERQG
ncbi:MAG: aspartate aminotransferase family protein [Chloroflexi bacterium]|nr:aspartate aminotransferase family protein [Chloroflexota bacterium]